MCTGLTQGQKNEALTPWLHGLIQTIAGRSVDDPPLTFGDLWSAPGFPAWLDAPKGHSRSIDLQMFTTSVSHGRPYILPIDEGDRSRLFFNVDELKRFCRLRCCSG
jgi:hypothetical protein